MPLQEYSFLITILNAEEDAHLKVETVFELLRKWLEISNPRAVEFLNAVMSSVSKIINWEEE